MQANIESANSKPSALSNRSECTRDRFANIGTGVFFNSGLLFHQQREYFQARVGG